MNLFCRPGSIRQLRCTWSRGVDPVLYLAPSFPSSSASLPRSFHAGVGGCHGCGCLSLFFLSNFVHPLTHLHPHTPTRLITDAGLLPSFLVFFVPINLLILCLNLIFFSWLQPCEPGCNTAIYTHKIETVSISCVYCCCNTTHFPFGRLIKFILFYTKANILRRPFGSSDY